MIIRTKCDWGGFGRRGKYGYSVSPNPSIIYKRLNFCEEKSRVIKIRVRNRIEVKEVDGKGFRLVGNVDQRQRTEISSSRMKWDEHYGKWVFLFL